MNKTKQLQKKERAIMRKLLDDPCMVMSEWSDLVNELHNVRNLIRKQTQGRIKLTTVQKKQYETNSYNLNLQSTIKKF